MENKDWGGNKRTTYAQLGASNRAPVKLFFEKDLQLLMFDKRIKFINNGIVQNKITFKTAYYCYNLLPKQIIMERLEDK